MMDTQKFTISIESSAREAIERINQLAIPNVSIFIIDMNGKLEGSITDGDIRRGLLKGKSIDDSIDLFMNVNSKYFVEGEDNYTNVNRFKNAGIRLIPVVNSQRILLKIIDLELLHSLLPLDVVLMAGGKGERLKPLTDKTPKPMLHVGDKPIIVRNIERIANFGVDQFNIAVRHMADQIKDGLNINEFAHLRLNFVEEEEPLGTIGALSLIDDFKNDTILLMNADLLTNIDFSDFYKKFIDSESEMQVATIPYNIDVPYAVMDIDDSGRVKAFNEKPRYTFYSNAGIYIFKKELISLIPKGENFDATHFMELVMEKGNSISTYPILGYWLDIGRPEDYYKAQNDVKVTQF